MSSRDFGIFHTIRTALEVRLTAHTSTASLICGDWKLMRNVPFSPIKLDNLRDDPQETLNFAASNRKKFEELATALRSQIQGGGSTPLQPSKL